MKEINQLSEQELGRQIVQILDLPSSDEYFGFFIGDNPRYFEEICTDLNTVAEIEKILVGKDLGFKYAGYVERIVRNGRFSYNSYETLTADARTRAEAALSALRTGAGERG